MEFGGDFVLSFEFVFECHKVLEVFGWWLRRDIGSRSGSRQRDRAGISRDRCRLRRAGDKFGLILVAATDRQDITHAEQVEHRVPTDCPGYRGPLVRWLGERGMEARALDTRFEGEAEEEPTPEEAAE